MGYAWPPAHDDGVAKRATDKAPRIVYSDALLESAMEPDGFYRCPACGRCYKWTGTPDKCAVCGANSGSPEPDKNSALLTDKFKLAVNRAKGNF